MNHHQNKSRAEQHAKAVLNGNTALDIDPNKEAAMNAEEDRTVTYILNEL